MHRCSFGGDPGSPSQKEGGRWNGANSVFRSPGRCLPGSLVLSEPLLFLSKEAAFSSISWRQLVGFITGNTPSLCVEFTKRLLCSFSCSWLGILAKLCLLGDHCLRVLNVFESLGLCQPSADNDLLARRACFQNPPQIAQPLIEVPSGGRTSGLLLLDTTLTKIA